MFDNENNLTKSTLVANLFYDDLDYSIVNEVPVITFDTLISNIGGNLGLFIGISILSIMELFEYVIQAIILFLSKYKK